MNVSIIQTFAFVGDFGKMETRIFCFVLVSVSRFLRQEIVDVDRNLGSFNILMHSLFINFQSDIFERVLVVLAPQRCSRLFKCGAKVKEN